MYISICVVLYIVSYFVIVFINKGTYISTAGTAGAGLTAPSVWYQVNPRPDTPPPETAPASKSEGSHTHTVGFPARLAIPFPDDLFTPASFPCGTSLLPILSPITH